MATLVLPLLWVNLMATGQAVAGYSDRDTPRDEVWLSQVDTRTYAGGRRRAITSPGVATTFQCRMILLPRPSVDLLISWSGQLVQVRDNKSRRFFGTYPRVAVVEPLGLTTWHADFTLTVSTADESV